MLVEKKEQGHTQPSGHKQITDLPLTGCLEVVGLCFLIRVMGTLQNCPVEGRHKARRDVRGLHTVFSLELHGSFPSLVAVHNCLHSSQFV